MLGIDTNGLPDQRDEIFRLRLEKPRKGPGPEKRWHSPPLKMTGRFYSQARRTSFITITTPTAAPRKFTHLSLSPSPTHSFL